MACVGNWCRQEEGADRREKRPSALFRRWTVLAILSFTLIQTNPAYGQSSCMQDDEENECWPPRSARDLKARYDQKDPEAVIAIAMADLVEGSKCADPAQGTETLHSIAIGDFQKPADPEERTQLIGRANFALYRLNVKDETQIRAQDLRAEPNDDCTTSICYLVRAVQADHIQASIEAWIRLEELWKDKPDGTETKTVFEDILLTTLDNIEDLTEETKLPAARHVESAALFTALEYLRGGDIVGQDLDRGLKYLNLADRYGNETATIYRLDYISFGVTENTELGPFIDDLNRRLRLGKRRPNTFLAAYIPIIFYSRKTTGKATRLS